MDARRRLRTVAAVLSALLLPRLALATVWTVSPPGGGGQFNDIQSAVNAAVPGDTVLVLAGTYPAFVLDKALRILGVGPALVTVSVTAQGGLNPPPPPPAVVQVSGIPAGGFALLAGMRIEILTTYPTVPACGAIPSVWPSATAVSVEGCAGPVVLSNLQLAPGHYFHGLTANLSTAVLVDHVSVAAPQPGCEIGGFCSVFGTGACVRAGIQASWTNLSLNDSSVLGVVGATALELLGSSQSLVARTSLTGADGLTKACGAFAESGIDGGHGLLAANGATVRVAAGSPVTIRGGDGGDAIGQLFGSCCLAGDGGHAVTSSGGTVLLAPGLPLLPGSGGFALSASCAGSFGQAISGSGVSAASAPLPSLGVSPALSSPGGTVTLNVAGAPASAFALGASNSPGFIPIPGAGPLLLDPGSLALVASGALDATGTATISVAIPPDPLFSTLVLFLQPATLGPSPSAFVLGPAVPVVIL